MSKTGKRERLPKSMSTQIKKLSEETGMSTIEIVGAALMMWGQILHMVAHGFKFYAEIENENGETDRALFLDQEMFLGGQNDGVDISDSD
jgi:hypothetical protein